MGKLTVKTVAALRRPGMHGDGDGLYLLVGPSGVRSWICRVTVHGKRKEIGLGSVELVGLAEARDKARAIRKLAKSGVDPLAEKKKARTVPSFAEAAKAVHAEHLPTWKNRKHAETWLATVQRYAVPAFGDKPVNKVTPAEVHDVLSPIWTTKHETAKRLRQRLATIFDWAVGKGHMSHSPISGRAKALPKVKARTEHQPSMPWRDVPAFMADLAGRPGVSARCLEFIIHTAARSGEARGARWDEIDLEAKVWNVPASRMKRDKPHRVPLSAEALGVLEAVRGLDPALCFPSPVRGKAIHAQPMSDAVFKALFVRMGRQGFTTHGFRSSFRDWCSESAKAPRELAEAALSHATGSAVEQAYARSDLAERRRPLMERWGKFLTGTAGKVVRLTG
ncbi:MAG: integrase arm-type DNA-binding domain-containing protein [Paracoccus sp. (in: a-proteobacteria)]|nr:integrase arm-type DNA-binding domain-containing protein [Paracoccus sp. (in: a-proteobacteria)]